MTTRKASPPVESQEALARTEESPAADPGFDMLDVFFGFPLAATLAHALLGGVATGLAPVSLPAVIPAALLFIVYKVLRSTPQAGWKSLDFFIALLPDATFTALPAPAAELLIETERKVYARANGEAEQGSEQEVEEGDWSEEGAATTPPPSAQSKGGSPGLPMIDLATLARCSTILLVGSRGSGKSTLLRALLAARSDEIRVFDPHASPHDWPMAARTYNAETTIAVGLVSAYASLQLRKGERRAGLRLDGWPTFTLAADEWGDIVANVRLPAELRKTPGEVSTELMKQGRKFAIGFVAGAHGLTNANLGCEGDKDGFLASFDWIIHMGKFTRDALGKPYAELFTKIPKGTNEQGGTFPLIVVCESPTTGELRLLDMRGFNKKVDTKTRPAAPTLPWEETAIGPTDSLLAGLLEASPSDMPRVTRDSTISRSDSEVTASERGVTGSDMVTEVTVTPAEVAFITMSLSRGMTPNQAAKAMKGCNGRTYKTLLAKVEFVKRLLDEAPTKDQASASGAASDDEPPAKAARPAVRDSLTHPGFKEYPRRDPGSCLNDALAQLVGYNPDLPSWSRVEENERIAKGLGLVWRENVTLAELGRTPAGCVVVFMTGADRAHAEYTDDPMRVLVTAGLPPIVGVFEKPADDAEPDVGPFGPMLGR